MNMIKGITINKIFNGGILAGHRTYIISGIGILSAIGAYLVGDSNIFAMLQTVFILGGIYFLRKSNETINKTKGNKNGKGTGKISE